MTINFDTHSLISYLRESHVHPELQRETGQIYVIYKIKEIEVPFFFSIRPESSALQIVAYLPYTFSSKTVCETGRLLHLLNRELDIPGFGMDEMKTMLFYRSVIPCFEGKIETRLLNMYLGIANIACSTCMHVIGMIASGNTTLDAVLKQKKQYE